MSLFTEQIKEIFSEGGLLSRLDNHEYRKQQQEMAVYVAECLENNTHAVIEAPTGVGKSFAYLIPSIYHSKEHNRKAVISTCTINLQEQLVSKDLPALKEILPVDFSYDIIKGRANYICPRRLAKAMADSDTLFDTPEKTLLKKIYNFTQKTGRGTRQDINFSINENVWSEIFAEEGICTSKTCGGEDSSCWYQLAKRQMEKSDVLVINHHLFFTLLGIHDSDSGGYLYLNDFVIFDEAHTIEKIAASVISPQVSKEQIRFWLKKIFNPAKEKGLYAKREGADPIKNMTTSLLWQTDDFFRKLENEVYKLYPNKQHKTSVRILQKLNINDDYPERLAEFSDMLKKSVISAKSDLEEDEINNYITKINIFRNNIIDFLNLEPEDYVHWIEISSSKNKNITLCTSPLDLRDYFRKNVFTPNKLSILTSATLAVNGKTDFITKNIGARGIRSKILPSPFDFKTQVKTYVYENMPDHRSSPQKVSDIVSAGEYELSLMDKIYECVNITSGGALVLFTNIRVMKKCHEGLADRFTDSKINLLVQDDGLPNNKLLEMFREDINSVLFGVDSFWMGVDIPGKSLRNLIITKLPFDVPDDPLTEAKLEYLRKTGLNPFIAYSLPAAILKFRQGIGRLIRSKTDKGIICILDSRVISKTYGKHFLETLMDSEIIIKK